MIVAVGIISYTFKSNLKSLCLLLFAFCFVSLNAWIFTARGEGDHSAAPATSSLPKAFHAYSWEKVNPELNYIIPFHWLRVSDLEDLDSAVAKTKAATDSMPEGHRVLFSWDLHREISYHPADILRDSLGNNVGYTNKEGRFIPYRGIWWDHGIEPVRKRFDAFFRQYAAVGGHLDVFVLDFEEGFSNWHLEDNALRKYGNDAESYFLAIQNDSRFEPISRELGLKDILTILYWYTGDNYLKWNAFMGDRVAAYLNEAVYEPIKKYFPHVKMSNYGNYHYSQKFPVPDRNGHPIYTYGEGNHVGTHQSYNFYGWMGNIKLLNLDGVHKYEPTPFNAFRYEVNKIRAMKLSSDIPIYPWVSHKEFDASLLNQSDLYQELIFHIGLTGGEDFLFWNPYTSVPIPATPMSNELLNDCLKEMNALIGFDDRKTLVDRLVGWGDNYVLTGMKANNRTVWRFTLKLEKDQHRDTVLINVFPATFRVGSHSITIPNGKVFIPEKEGSQHGYWIIEQQ